MDDKEKREAKERFVNYMTNPRAFTLKRWLYELLKEKYSEQHDKTAERIAASVHTNQDMEDFGKLLTEVFEVGYRKAVDDYKVQAEKHGLKVHIVPQQPS